MPLFKGKDGSGKELLFVEEEGNVYPQGIVEFGMQNDLKKKLHDVRTFETRDDDVFICAYAKAGSNVALRKLAHSIYRDFFPFKKMKISSENFDIFLIFAQNIDCG